MKKSLSFTVSIWGAILMLIALIAPLQKAYAAPSATITVDTKSSDLSKFAPAQVALATVGKGEGIEHAFTRQLIANPGLCDNIKPCKPFSGDRNDEKALKQWAGQQSGVVAFKAGYVDKFGAEVRVKEANKVAYLIQKNADGSLQIVEGTVTAPPTGPATTPASSAFQLSGIAGAHTVVATTAAAEFIGASPITGDVIAVPVYEYVYLG